MSRNVEEFCNFCQKEGIGAQFHRKEKTQGCLAAIQERSRILGKRLDLKYELKTLLLQTKQGNLIAIHMPGNKELISKLPQLSDHCRDYRHINPPSAAKYDCVSDRLKLPKDNKIVGILKGEELGTLNPISLYLRYGCSVEQYFDASLDIKETYYTNMGNRNYGAKMKLESVMAAIPHKIADVCTVSYFIQDRCTEGYNRC